MIELTQEVRVEMNRNFYFVSRCGRTDSRLVHKEGNTKVAWTQQQMKLSG